MTRRKKTPPPAGLVAMFRMLDDDSGTLESAQMDALRYLETIQYPVFPADTDRDTLIDQLAGEPDDGGEWSPEERASAREAHRRDAAFWLGVTRCWLLMRDISGGVR